MESGDVSGDQEPYLPGAGPLMRYSLPFTEWAWDCFLIIFLDKLVEHIISIAIWFLIKLGGIRLGTQILLVWLVELYIGKNIAGTQVRFIDWIVEIAHTAVRNYWPIGRENLRPDQSDHPSLRP